MQNSNVFQLIQSFTALEQKHARRFLESPYFNLRADLVQLFDCLCATQMPDKNEIWVALFPTAPFDDTQFRLLLSYLNQLLENFLLVEGLDSKSQAGRLELARIYRQRGLVRHYERQINQIGRELTSQPLRNAQHHNMQRDFHLEQYNTQLTLNPTNSESIRVLAWHTDMAYLLHRLRLICLELAQKNVYRASEDHSVNLSVIRLAERAEWADSPGIALYLAASRLLSYPEDVQHYSVFMQLLPEQERYFSPEEMREFYMFAINHCIRQTNRGQQHLEQEMLRLYRRALEAGYLFENGILSRFTYHNIVAAGLRCGELDWVGKFIPDYNVYLEPMYRNSALSFNQARLDYARNQYDSVLLLLQKANYNDPLLNLAAKTLLLKTYFVLQEFDLLQSHLDAMRNYIHRKKVIGYHRKNFLNIIRFTERISNLAGLDRQAREQIRQQIRDEPVLTEKEWLLECLVLN
ncbi:MAG: hypothetical protein H6569_03695 [Lewinellaceae bacterium]|nr:hypothetical protein [Lewinellaceae bacterium]